VVYAMEQNFGWPRSGGGLDSAQSSTTRIVLPMNLCIADSSSTFPSGSDATAPKRGGDGRERQSQAARESERPFRFRFIHPGCSRRRTPGMISLIATLIASCGCARAQTQKVVLQYPLDSPEIPIAVRAEPHDESWQGLEKGPVDG